MKDFKAEIYRKLSLKEKIREKTKSERENFKILKQKELES